MSSSGADMAGQFAGSGQGAVASGSGADMAGQFAGSDQGAVVNGSDADMAGDLRKRSGVCDEWFRCRYGGAICESGQGAAADGAGDEIGLGRDKGLKQW